jgi:hypothetical protein
MIQNLRQVAGNKNTLTREQFRNSSRRKFASVTIEKYFGSFTAAVRKAKIGR